MQIVRAARNAWAVTFGDGIEEPHETPSVSVHDEPHQVLRRFDGSDPAGNPILLVPPLAAPARCFDLRSGQSVAEFLIESGRRPYVVDYGEIGFADRAMGFEDWIDEIIPNAVRRVSEAEDGRPVDLMAWSIGGTLSLLTAAAHTELPIRSITAVGSPIDYGKLPAMKALRRFGRLTRGEPMTTVNRITGGIPSPLVQIGYKLTALERTLTKPAFIARNALDTDALGKMEAIDRFMAAMPAYPGRFYGQLHGRLMLRNDLGRGVLKLGDRRIELSQVKVPVLLVGGTTDNLTTLACAQSGVDVLTGAPLVRFEAVAGSHLGILTGPEARTTTCAHLDDFLRGQDSLED